MSGLFPVHDLPDLEIPAATGPYTTLGGLVMDRLGRLARVSDVVDIDGWRIEVVEAAGRSVTRVRLTKR